MNNDTETVHLPRPVDETDHSLGPVDAPAVLVQYGDYECPYCRDLHPVIQELIERTEGLRFVYRHFPLSSLHQFAARASQAAEAAGAQGRFWEMHNAIYAERRELNDARLEHCARGAGLDLDRYRKEMAENLYAAKVEMDYESALYGGVSGTPTLFLNSALLSFVHTLDELLAAVTGAGATLHTNRHDHAGWVERLRQLRLGRSRHSA
jgi:protein-disulfide isomerase